jgi:hypothetical protein
LSHTLQLEKVTTIRELHDAPRLLVEWSPRWDEFVTSIGPAFARSGPRLAGEAGYGEFPYRGLAASLLLQFFVLIAALLLPREIDRLRPYAAPRLQPDEVIYYSGDELPRTEDLGGSQAGASGRAGGREAHHRTQTIRIARGSSLAAKVVDAPNLKLPSSSSEVANLLAFKSIPAAPLAEGLHSSLTAPALSANVIPPAPDAAGSHSRRGVQLNSVIAPAPSVSANSARAVPSLNAAVVPPAPVVYTEHTLIAPILDPSVIAPAPKVSGQHRRAAPSLNANVIAPAPSQVSRDPARSNPMLSADVVPPAPSNVHREVPSTRVQMTNVAVVPPPVSAPERESARTAKLNLPAPSVVAPPPTADSTHDLRRLESGSASDSPRVVPPPPSQAGPSFVSSIIGKIFGPQEVVPPPPSVSSNSHKSTGGFATNVVPPPPNVSAGNRNAGAGTLAANVVPPAPLNANGVSGGTSRMSPRAPVASIVPPPPSVTGSDSTAGFGTSQRSSSNARLDASIVPPPPSVNGSKSGSRNGAGDTLASNVVPPPPAVNSASPSYGSGRRGSGFGGPGDAGSALAPPKSANGNNDNAGVVVSARPGANVAVPGTGGKGSLAMSPAGTEKPGIGGSGGGTGIGRGEGSGSGLTAKNAENPGAAKSGSGRGSDSNARGGTSSVSGPGGAGSLPAGTPAVPGVDVRGGSTIVTLPSFGSDGNGDPPALPGRTNVKTPQGPAITIVATSRSGGAFNFYGKLPGDNYTVYVDTAIGTVVMQFAEADPRAAAAQPGSLTGPEGIRTNLPANLPRARMVVKCRLDASGNIKHVEVLEPGPATMTAKVVAALPGWKFRPAMRGAQPVEINAILGFNIDTNDRY